MKDNFFLEGKVRVDCWLEVLRSNRVCGSVIIRSAGDRQLLQSVTD